jgi:hypothetical protein
MPLAGNTTGRLLRFVFVVLKRSPVTDGKPAHDSPGLVAADHVAAVASRACKSAWA